MSEDPPRAAPPDAELLQEEADRLLQYVITEMELSPARALAVFMCAAAMIVSSAHEVPAFVGQTKLQAIADFEEMIDTLIADRRLDLQTPKGSA